MDPTDQTAHAGSPTAERPRARRHGTTRKNADGSGRPRIDRRRYRRVRRFFARVFLHVVWFDLVLARPLLRRFRPAPIPRWTDLAADFRELALELGGVLIKLGQFLSTRVDVLPLAVTRELSGLQDRVPAAPFDDILASLEADVGPLDAIYEHLDEDAVGAASLAQVHRARLVDGREVVVKVLRPGVDVLVETDLAATRLAFRWLGFSKTVRQRVDLDRMFAELASTTRAELDLHQEGIHAERFADLFEGDPFVATPRIFREPSGRRSLVMERIEAPKISDLDALEAQGVSRRAVARRLHAAYMEQVFDHFFIHCDPHPGNLFVRPLDGPRPDWDLPGRPFQLVFIDFGMVTTIPPRLRDALRAYAMALANKDSEGLVRAYVDAGILLPGADLERLEEAHDLLFDRLWGVRLADLQGVALSEAEAFFREYRDLIFEAPFQFPVDLLFTLRAVGILSGLATDLDPGFDPWGATVPFAERMAREEAGEGLKRGLREAADASRRLLRLPRELDRLLERAEQGNVRLRASLAPDTSRAIHRLERAVGRLSWTFASGSLLVAGVLLDVARPDGAAAPWLYGAAAVAFLWGLARR